MKRHHVNLTLLALSLYAGTCATAQTLPKISVNQDRPLTEAAKQLGNQLGVVITFEEMEFEHPDDFEEVQWRSETLVVPKSGEFNFQYAPTSPTSEIVSSLLDTYHETFPGKYKLIEEKLETNEDSMTIFHIVPDASKDISGTYVPRHSILDIPLSVQSAEASNVEDIVCGAVIQQAAALQDTSISCITDFAPQLKRTQLDEYHAENVTARTHLVKLLHQTGQQISWTLLRSSETGQYAIHFYSVK